MAKQVCIAAVARPMPQTLAFMSSLGSPIGRGEHAAWSESPTGHGFIAGWLRRRILDLARSEHGWKVSIRLGPALSTIARLPGDKPFDFAFLDADKESCPACQEAVRPLLRPGGMLVADNVLWAGTLPQLQATRRARSSSSTRRSTPIHESST